MASIEKRTTKDGKISYRCKIRRKDQKPLTATLTTKADAENWCIQHESAILAGRYFNYVESRYRTLADAIARYGEERGWCRKVHVKEDRVAYGWFVTPNTETDCLYFKYDPRNWDGISESVKERFDMEDWSGATFTWSDEENDGDDG